MNTVHDLHQAYGIFQQEKINYFEKVVKLKKKRQQLNLLCKIAFLITFLCFALATYFSYRSGQILYACVYSFNAGINLMIFIQSLNKKI